ncbi:MAG: ribonuclease III [Gammaproteobacteria bacterium]|nr:ribonuclease III [Gammaproteobacteria bacterium]
MTAALESLAARLGYRFTDWRLLQDAVTHRSAGSRNNERLEFLGDAVLNLMVADALFDSHPDAREGDLSRLRATLVNRETLARIAQELEISECLVLGPGEMKSGGHRRQSILADAVEAVLGAIYRDGGYAACAEVVHRLLDTRLAELPDPETLKDPKTRLQEFLQSRQRPLPDYRVLEVSGEEHARSFLVECRVEGLAEAPQARGRSRRKAEQAAASKALQRLSRG